MRNVKLLLIGLFFAAAYAMAGGAASFVAKKSNTGEFAFSEATQQAFLKDCSENANEWVCGCVLGRLQGSYSEKEYLRLDAEMQRGDQDYNFTSFLSDAVTACDKEYEEASSVITEEEAKTYVDNWVKTTKRRDFVDEIPPQLMEAFGKNTARKIRGCVYDNIVKDRERFVQTVMEEGYPEDNKMWGINYALDCIPEKFTPEIEKTFIKLLNERGLPKSISQCIMKSIKKEYTMKSIFAGMIADKELFVAMFTMYATKCAVE
ncbi:hypothetical protein SAMN05720781_3034 [Fibrobacter sp. UWT3]|uniref:hypothetical protein n=1 Tax=Fibrobacter sp. UWT3 TaxID=1896225 RepID=UPI000BCEDF2C|nr:hypothetical protein [Fibrobacter sp. UWT3]SOE79409.1 hypothetical protein SAMN05720781_3034 [Fibrobacter sp. UWT3]